MSDRNNSTNVDEDGFNPNEYEEDDDDEQQDIDPRSVSTLYLKEMAQDGFNTPWDKLAEQMDIPRSQADSIIKQLVQTMVGTYREGNFPRRLIDHYNRYAPRPADELTTEDVVVLMKLIDRYVKKIDVKDMAKIHDKMKRLGTIPQQQEQETEGGKPRYDPRDDAVPVPDIPHRRVTYTDSSYNNQQGQGQGQQQGLPPTMGQAPPQQQQQQGGQPQQGDVYSPFENEESLLKYFLEMNYTVRDPQRISRFMMFFRTNKAGFLANPMSLLVALKGMFGDRAAEATMQMFMDARQKLPTTAGSLYRITGASDYKPIIDPASYLGQANPHLAEFMNQYGTGAQFGGQPFPNMPFQGPAEDPLDKELQRLSKIIGMTMMKGMAQPGAGGGAAGGQNGQAYDPSLYDVHEVFDAAGRMTERRLVRKGFPTFPGPTQNPSGADATTQMMMKFMETMLNTANSDRQLIMNKMLSGDNQGGMNSVMETMLKQFAGVMTQQIDPSVALTKYLDLGEKVAALRQQPQKTADERRLEMDFLLAKTEMQNKEAEKQREYERQREEANSADNRYQDTVKQVGDIIKEAAGPAIEIFKNTMGRGLGGGPGMYPPAGYPPQGMPPQQQQQERVIVQQVPVEQQQAQPQQYQQQGQPQYTPEQIRLLQQEQMRQQQEAQRQAEFENRPIDEVIGEIPDDQLEEMARQFGDDMVRMEHTGNKVMAELARRKGRGFTPRRQHVAPIIQAVAEHEHQQQQQQQQYAAQQPYEPEEPSINVFDDEPRNTNATSSAVDFSDSYDDENVRESLKVDGLLSKDDAENEEQIDTDENQSVGVPSSSSMPPTKTREEPPIEEPEPVVEIDESSIVDGSDTVIEQ